MPTESDGSGDAVPIGLYRNGKFFAVHSDHLNTPRKITDETNKLVWQWPYSAFGDNKPTGILKATVNPNNAYTQDPTTNARLQATTPAITYNLRMPGQYFDFETGLFYNTYRSYNSGQGRYTQGDPIGLDGGLNRFGYVAGNPLSYVDPLGLEKIILLPTNDINYPAAAAAPDIPGRLTIFAHGNPNRVAGRDAATLAEELRSGKIWKPGMPITLDACRTGEGDSNIAKDLAKNLDTTVTAPNSRTLTFRSSDLGPWHSLNIPGTERTIPYWPGKWNTFSAPSGK